MTNDEPPTGASAANPLLDEAIRWCLRMTGKDAELHRADFEAWLALGGVHREIYSQVSEIYGFGETLRGIEIDRSPVVSAADDDRARTIMAQPRPGPRNAVRAILAVCVLIVGGWYGWQSRTVPEHPVVEARWAPFQSVVGEIRTLRLEDGSTLTLDTDSLVETAFDKNMRRLRLARGRARFAVASDNRPFVVEAQGAHLSARGTVFDVTLPAAASVDVTLLQGTLDVRSARAYGMMRPAVFTRLTSGMVARVRPGRQIALRSMSRADISAARWPTAVAAFEDVPLGEVIRQANRYARIKIVLGDPGLAQKRFFGTVRIDDTRQLARLLGHAFSLRVTRQGNTITLSPT